MLDLRDQLPHPSFAVDAERPSGDAQFGAGRKIAGEDDARRIGRDVHEAADAGSDLGARGEPGHVDVALPVDLEERQQRGIEAAALQIGELVRRRNDGFGVGRASEFESQQRNPADRPLLQDPGDGAVRAFLQQDAGDVGGDAEADVGRHPAGELHGDAAGDDLLRPELGDSECFLGLHGLAADGGVEHGLCGLPLLRLDNDIVDQHAGHVHSHRLQRAGVGAPLDLRDDDAAVVAGRQRLVESAEVGPLMLPRNIAALVRGGAANDGDIGHDRREIEPGVAVELGAADDRVSGGCVVHGAALKLRIDEGAEPHLGEHARALGRGVAGHVEKNPARHVVCRNFVIHDEAPNGRHRQG